MSTNGRLPLPPYANNSPTKIHNITIFLYSYDTGKNFTITNGTSTANNASLSDIMFSEPGSTVKHVKWMWPDCLVGDGQPSTVNSARGSYNVKRPLKCGFGFFFGPNPIIQISIRQNFRLNGEDHYTIFDLPISVTNKIEFDLLRPSCDSLNNPLLGPAEVNISANSLPVMFAPGDSTVIQTGNSGSGGDGLGPSKPEAGPGQGLGGAGTLSWRSGAHWICLLSIAIALAL